MEKIVPNSTKTRAQLLIFSVDMRNLTGLNQTVLHGGGRWPLKGTWVKSHAFEAWNAFSF